MFSTGGIRPGSVCARKVHSAAVYAWTSELGVPAHWIAMTITAIGRPAQEPPLEGRVRRPLDDVWWR